jgi:transposase
LTRAKFKAVNNRGKNFTEHKLKVRLAQVEESVGRYLTELDGAGPTLVSGARVSRLKEKMQAAKAYVQKPREIGEQRQKAPNNQISLTDPDARSMAASGRGLGWLATAFKRWWKPSII